MTMNRTLLPGSVAWLQGDKMMTAPLDDRLLSYELYNADRVRVGNAYPRQRNLHGYYWMASTGRHIWHESLLERDMLMHLDHTAGVVAIASQPMRLTNADGVHHYPDFLALDARGIQTVYDVKPASRINEKALHQFEWTRSVCAHVGWDYRVLTELPPQERVNLAWLALFRHPEYRPGVDAAGALFAALEPGFTIADAVAHMPAESTPAARSRVFHLMWTRELLCDMAQRLTDATPVTAPKEVHRGIA